MTIQELKYLVAVAEHRHFGQAASACHVSQPTLSAGLANLEDKLAVVLFERGPQGVFPTPAGEPLIMQARRVLAEAQNLEQMARQGSQPLTGEFRLGAIPTIGPYLYPHIIAGLQERWPQLQLNLIEKKTDDLLRDLRRGELDLALLSPPFDAAGLDFAHLYREKFLLALPLDYRLKGKRLPRLADLEQKKVLLLDEGHCLRDQVVEFCRLGDARARELTRSSSLEILRHLVAAGRGCTLLPALSVRADDGVRIRSMAKPEPHREVGLYWRRTSVTSESANLLAKTIRDLLPDTVQVCT